MKKLILIATLLSGAAQAEPICHDMANFAKIAMKSRQDNVSLQAMHKATEAVKWQQVVLEEAYNSPRYHTELAKYDAVMDFENRTFSVCLKAVENKKKGR